MKIPTNISERIKKISRQTSFEYRKTLTSNETKYYELRSHPSVEQLPSDNINYSKNWNTKTKLDRRTLESSTTKRPQIRQKDHNLYLQETRLYTSSSDTIIFWRITLKKDLNYGIKLDEIDHVLYRTCRSRLPQNI